MTDAHAENEDPSAADIAELTRLEESLWREDMRFDKEFLERYVAADFFEFGRSGRTYLREQTVAVRRQPIHAVLPLPNLSIRLLNEHVAQVSYNSSVDYDGIVEHGRRSSIWTRADGRWVLRFHQGTPYQP